MNQMQSGKKQQKSSSDQNSLKSPDDAALKKHKSHVLAKYSEVSDEEFDYGNDQEASGNVLFQNTNTQDIEDREKKSRDLQQEVSRNDFLFDMYFDNIRRYIKNNKRKIKSMLIIRNKKMMRGKRKHNNELKNKNDDVNNINLFLLFFDL